MRWNATAARRQRVLVGLQLIRCRALNGARANWMRRCSGLEGFEVARSGYSSEDSGK
jgi:hypothetical protein